MEKVTFFFEQNPEGGVDIKFHLPEEPREEHLLVPRHQMTNLTCDGDILCLSLKGGNTFVLIDGARVNLFFIWDGRMCKTSEGEVIGLYRRHCLPMPFSVYYERGVPCLNQREWMVI